MREGFDPDEPEPHNPEQIHNLDRPFTVGDNEDVDEDEGEGPQVSEEATHWQTRDYSNENNHDNDRHNGNERISPQYGSFHEERNAWGGN